MRGNSLVNSRTRRPRLREPTRQRSFQIEVSLTIAPKADERRSPLSWSAWPSAGSICVVLLLAACGTGNDARTNAPQTGVPEAGASAAGATGSAPVDSAGGASSTQSAGGANAAGGASSLQDASAPSVDAAGALSPPILPPLCGSNTSGIYTIPVSSELVPYASFPIENIRFCRDSTIELSYTLPPLLLGDGLDVSFTGTLEPSAGAFSLNGPNGSALCSAIGSSWTCQEHLSGLSANADQLNHALDGLPSAEAQARLAVSNHFLTDPIGALTFETR